MIEISALDLHYLIKEMKFLEGAKVDKITQPAKEIVIFQFYSRGKGKYMLKMGLPNFFYLANKKAETAEKQFGFCAALRKYLLNSRLETIEQAGSERIAKLLFRTKEERYMLFAELFAKGNIILCKKDSTIIVPLNSRKFKDRTIKAGVRYEPPSREIDFFELSVDDLKSAAKKEQTISKTLAVDFGFGGKYAKELCLLSGIGQKEKTATDEQIKKLFKAVKSLIDRKISSFVFYSDDKIEAISPFELKVYESLRRVSKKSFNDAVEFAVESEIGKKLTKEQKEIEKMRKIIEVQEKNITSLEKSAEENQKIGEMLYENYKILNEIVNEIRKARKKYSWQEIKEKLEGHKVVKEVNEKKGEVVVEL